MEMERRNSVEREEFHEFVSGNFGLFGDGALVLICIVQVGAVTWNPKESNLLLSGSYDRTVAVIDVRTPEAGEN
jgi:hypothetical protein